MSNIGAHRDSAVQWSQTGITERLRDLYAPGAIVSDGRRLGLLPEPRKRVEGVQVLVHYPPLRPEDLGDPAFRSAYGVRGAYMSGAMANGLASADLVIAMAKAGFLASYGAGGVRTPDAEAAIVRIAQAVGGHTFAVNLIHSPHEPAMEEGLVDALLRHGVRVVEASAFMSVTRSVVRYRAAGLSRGADGSVVIGNRVIAKVSRPEVAEQFMSTPPAAMLDALVADGAITAEQRELALRVPVADDITAEADSGGHTDRRPLSVLLPMLCRLRDRIAAERDYAAAIRVGAGGGIGAPEAAAGAFAMGASYIVTGSINQPTKESGTSDVVRAMLVKAGIADSAMAPAADMFEMGVELQVLRRGTMFASRAKQLYQLYNRYDSLEALPPEVRKELEEKYYKRSLDQVWQETVAYFESRDPGQIRRAEGDPKRKMALVFRAYLGQASHWANAGVEDRRIDYQVWTGPAIGDFNDWVAGTYLEPMENRSAPDIAEHMLRGAAFETRLNWLTVTGVRLPFRPRYAVAPL